MCEDKNYMPVITTVFHLDVSALIIEKKYTTQTGVLISP